ncbi:hypothetical protein CONCODRAFT_80302 [Conidiobolus coronatus NRRL 28638]|uniref:Uncharacterized protein n=1 Tax=Conidiobolus coronatus (strain ATCC 28846 / CBS 209.66 / NRRL 28638) TaxID=796925 RepID=A0A137NW77_CONC2|nr:hypothetical protein CONCODRAFT_80302 [Conidiobolus coronatus NRRL 28638]|eukprot:KXN67026.1 hypothetical protein CONCODRAFT_80302 [Conidiobolus coronatus NRRL 28638]
MPLVINMEVTDAEQQDQWFEQAHWMLGVIYDKNQKTGQPDATQMTGASSTVQQIHHARSTISTHVKKPNHPVSPIPTLFQYDEEKSFLKQFAEYDNIKESNRLNSQLYTTTTNTSTTSQSSSSKFSMKLSNLSEKWEKNLFNLKSKWSSSSSSSTTSSTTSSKKNRDSSNSNSTWCSPSNFDADLCHSVSRSNSLLMDAEDLILDEGSSKASSPTNSYISAKGAPTLRNVYELEHR